MANKKLPEYESPPLNEVVMDVTLQPLGLRVPHFGLFWEAIREDYGLFDVKLPLSRQEPTVTSQPSIQFEPLTPDTVRCWFFDPTRTRLIQLQDDRFITNWRRVEGDEVYPRYHNELRPRFLKEWDRFQKFVESQEHDVQKLASPVPIASELLYVNHIPEDQAPSFQDLIAPWSGHMSQEFLPRPKHVSFAARFSMPDDRGTLTIACLPIIDSRGQRSLQLRLQANGALKSSDTTTLVAWFDLAHEWIVQGFTAVTTEKMHSRWGRKPELEEA